ncbi:MAG: hypothetical protein PHU79_05040 [Oscillospiraceae bacterium]|nr:hypothetical protein [Oscillospiraceae bacterium]
MLNRYFNATEDNIDFLYANISVKNIHFALISLDHILHHTDFQIGIYHDEHTYYFFHLQSLLTACGNISNVFYNNSKYNDMQITERCKRLRDTLGISKTEFPLIFQKEVRNTNEHFDERYEQFHGRVGDYNLIGTDTDPIMKSAIQSNAHLRTYDKENQTYHTYNRKLRPITYNLNELWMQLQKMLGRITSHPVFESAWVDSMPGEELK